MRGRPVLSSHFSPGPALQVGQRTACTFSKLAFLAFMVLDDAAICGRKMLSFAQELESPYHSGSPLSAVSENCPCSCPNSGHASDCAVLVSSNQGSVVEVVYVGVLNQSLLVIHVDSGTEFLPLRVITTEPGIGIRTLRPQRH